MLISMKHLTILRTLVGALLLFSPLPISCAQTIGQSEGPIRQAHSDLSKTQTSEEADRTTVLRSRVDMVLVPVSVTDKQERTVTDLTKDDFVLLDNNRPQTLTSVSLEDEPSSIGIVLDTSNSMANKIDRAKLAVHALLTNFNSDDEFFLITFSDRPHSPVGFTSSPELIENAVLGTEINGYTAVVDSINLALVTMREAKYSRKAIIVISDGGDNHSRGHVPDLVRTLEEGDILIYSIGLYDYGVATAAEILGPALLDKLTKRSGGAAFDTADGRETLEAVADIFRQVRSRYVLGYYPGRKPEDGKFHAIRVRLHVTHRPHLHVHAKAGYYAVGQ